MEPAWPVGLPAKPHVNTQSRPNRPTLAPLRPKTSMSAANHNEGYLDATIRANLTFGRFLQVDFPFRLNLVGRLSAKAAFSQDDFPLRLQVDFPCRPKFISCELSGAVTTQNATPRRDVAAGSVTFYVLDTHVADGVKTDLRHRPAV